MSHTLPSEFGCWLTLASSSSSTTISTTAQPHPHPPPTSLVAHRWSGHAPRNLDDHFPAAKLSASAGRRFNDRHDTHDRYTTSLTRQQRQEPASAFYQRAGLTHDYSRPSSSSGSAHTLRRTPQLDDLRPSRVRSRSVESPVRDLGESPDRSRQKSPSFTGTSQRRATSAFWASQPPHPALRISRRTHAAVQYVIEEFLRQPNNFTPVLEEENAQMSDLGGGRASNGGPQAIRTPRDVMRDRNAREAKRQEEQKAEEARRAEERRRSAERRAATVPGAAPRFSQASSQYTPDMSTQQGGFDGPSDKRGGGNRVSGADVLGEPVSRTQEYAQPRIRSSSGIAQPTAPSSGARRTTQAQNSPRQPSGSATQPGASSQAGASSAASGQREPASSFPHAFERWETLSSHWEGLTSYWMHKLESNTEEIRNTIPNASTLNRQITDLSAAGANLFHAVVELQRLRASSERKFQRWFFETRSDTERQQETHAQMDRQLKLERSAREEASAQRAKAEQAADLAKLEVVEARRELMISKEEARRAWEELGRRNQDALDLADHLKNGRVAVVGGVQVVPYFGGPSRTGSASQRPTTRDGPQQYGSMAGASSGGAAGFASPGEEAEYYRDRPSPTDTDPFTEQQQSRPRVSESEKSSHGAASYLPQSTGAEASMSRREVLDDQRTPQPPASASSPDAQRFYQHGPTETFLHSPPGSSSGGPVATIRPPTQRREDVRSEGSYVETISEGDTEYAIDAAGNIQHDEQGRPIVFRRRLQSPGEESEDAYDEDAIRHEREHAARYGQTYVPTGQDMPEAPSVPATSAQAVATYTPTTGAPSSGPDYEGSGYGGWDAVQTTRHHHPTRLSDVLEEDEDRSSRHTGH
ncbi:hypothetical protein LTR86_007496 [Recurvomyces mirabilis]|nr:hypothetical protein LTR86_007496 [Recurvomyces mirabilis]